MQTIKRSATLYIVQLQAYFIFKIVNSVFEMQNVINQMQKGECGVRVCGGSLMMQSAVQPPTTSLCLEDERIRLLAAAKDFINQFLSTEKRQ